MPAQSTTADMPPAKSRFRESTNKHTLHPTCGCCGSRILIVGMDIIKKCVCDPNAEKCPMCVKARCHCKCGAVAGGPGVAA